MARDRPVLSNRSSTAHSGDEQDRNEDELLDRRSYLKLSGAAATAVTALGLGSNSASASVGTEPAAYLDSADDYNHVSFDGNWERWFTNTHGGYTSTTTNHSRDGNALRVTWPAGEYYGATMEYLMLQNHGYQPDAGHVRYWVYFPDDWQFDSAGLGGTKLPGFAGTYQTGDHDIGPGGYGGRPADGTNGWSARVFNCRPDRAGGQGPIALGSQVYHAGDGGRHGAHPKWNGALDTGTWHRIDQYVEMNTPGQTDGAYRTWIDGDLALEMEGLYFRDAGYGDVIGIQALWAMFYFGGDWGSPVDQHMLFDDLELWLWHDRPETTGASGGEREPEDEAASVTTGAVDVGAESVTVEATVESVGGRDDLELWIGYRESGESGWEWTGGDPVSDAGSHTYTVGGLSEGTTYELRAELWVGSTDVDFGEIETVTTGKETDSADDSEGTDEPSVATGAVDVGDDSFTVEADVESVGGRDDLEVWIGYRESWEDGWAWAGGDRVSDTGDHTITVDGLREEAEYELRAELWVGLDDIDFGEIETITTGEDGGIEEPAVETGTIDVGIESIAVEADVESVGGRDDLELWVGYRESGESGWQWTGGDPVSDAGSHTYTVGGLSEGTTYELRAELWVGSTDVDFGETVTGTTGDNSDDDTGGEPAVETGSVDTGAESLRVEAAVESVGGRDDLEVWIGYRESWENGWVWTGGDVVSDSGSHTLTVDGLHQETEYELRAELWVGLDDIDFGEIVTVTTDR